MLFDAGVRKGFRIHESQSRRAGRYGNWRILTVPERAVYLRSTYSHGLLLLHQDL